MNEDAIQTIPVIPTGSLTLDRALGIGGFPRGRVIEIYGPESSGKTTMTFTLSLNVKRLVELLPSLMLNTHLTQCMLVHSVSK